MTTISISTQKDCGILAKKDRLVSKFIIGLVMSGQATVLAFQWQKKKEHPSSFSFSVMLQTKDTCLSASIAPLCPHTAVPGCCSAISILALEVLLMSIFIIRVSLLCKALFEDSASKNTSLAASPSQTISCRLHIRENLFQGGLVCGG